MDMFKRMVGTKQAAPPLPSSNSFTLATYDLIKTLGTGSFGRVFLARRKAGASPNLPPVVAIKRLKKADIIKQKQIDHVISEKKILAEVNHPFVVNFLGTAKDDRYLFIFMEYVLGGEFFTYLRRVKRFENNTAKFYAAHIVHIFDFLHGKNVIYRDLKPENILIDSSGYLKLTDFGFAKVIEYRTYTLCGTPEYIAPEVLLNKGHGKPVDWWTLGILIYEMIVGYPPFFHEDPLGIYQKILAGKIVFPKFFDRNGKSLVKHLLTPDLARRYGTLRNGTDDIKFHPWFESLDWNQLLRLNIPVPYKPTVKTVDDSSNFDSYPESTSNPIKISGHADPFTAW